MAASMASRSSGVWGMKDIGRKLKVENEKLKVKKD